MQKSTAALVTLLAAWATVRPAQGFGASPKKRDCTSCVAAFQQKGGCALLNAHKPVTQLVTLDCRRCAKAAKKHCVSATAAPMCDPEAAKPQLCPGDIACPRCGAPACPCPGPALPPCGCEQNGVRFCNFDFGSTGKCEACSGFSARSDCGSAGLPAAGAKDCSSRCFGEITACKNVYLLCSRPALQHSTAVLQKMLNRYIQNSSGHALVLTCRCLCTFKWVA